MGYREWDSNRLHLRYIQDTTNLSSKPSPLVNCVGELHVITTYMYMYVPFQGLAFAEHASRGSHPHT